MFDRSTVKSGGDRKSDMRLMIKKINRITRALREAFGVFDGSYAYIGPRCVQIDLTNKCNNDCIGCWCNSPLLEEKRLPSFITDATLETELVIQLLDDLSKMGTEEIYFAGGGEPFMHPEAISIIEYAKRKGFVVSVNTNFTLVDQGRAERLVKAGVDHLIVSVWAGTPAVYAATHPNKDEKTFGSIEKTLSFLNELKGKKGCSPIIKVYNVILKKNFTDFEAMIDFVKRTGSESVEFTLIDTIPGKTDRLLLSREDADNLLMRAQAAQKKYDGPQSEVFLANYQTFLRRLSNAAQEKGEYDTKAFQEVPCYAGWSFARIIANGDVNSCLKSHRIPIGNLHSCRFGELWNNDRQQEFRQRTVHFDSQDPYFRFIGNDTNASIGCYRSCDNLGHSLLVHNNLKRIPNVLKRLLRGSAAGAHTVRRMIAK
jgi:MoaA/NifB/PqqE/SkfB family radical SAM enzyme